MSSTGNVQAANNEQAVEQAAPAAEAAAPISVNHLTRRLDHSVPDVNRFTRRLDHSVPSPL